MVSLGEGAGELHGVAVSYSILLLSSWDDENYYGGGGDECEGGEVFLSGWRPHSV